MINFDELKKKVASGKVVTISVMVDAKQLFAMSFSVDTVAFNELFEVAKTVTTIADKPNVSSTANIAKTKVEAKVKTEPEPLDEDEPEEEEDEEDDSVDQAARDLNYEALHDGKPFPGESTSNDKPLTRQQIMEQEQQAPIRPTPNPEPVKKVEVKQTSLTDEW